ncbi:hypothetical protein ACFE04_016709 [Oxalis oulophora]
MDHDTFERHRVVFTVGTSIASIATALIGYGVRLYRDSRVDQRLESIENAMRNKHNIEHAELKKLVDPGNSRVATLVATAGTTFILGYGFGWRGGSWYTKRQFRREQMKLLGQIKPRRWQLLGHIKPRVQFLEKPLRRFRALKEAAKSPNKC